MFGSQKTWNGQSHLAIHIVATALDGLFKGQDIELQISRDQKFDFTQEYAGALFQSKPVPMFSVSTDSERFGYLVTLIAAKAFKQLYLCFEHPRYGKAKIISWHLSTTIDD